MPPPDAPSSDLGRLLQLHAAGDPAAVHAVLLHCRDRLKVLTRQMLRRFPGVQQWEDTSDVFHDVVINLTGALAALTFATPADFLRLAACHIRRELIDLARKRRPDLTAGPPDGPATTDDPFNLAVWEEVHSRVAALDPDDLALFDLLYYQGLTQPEAADLLGLPLRTLKTRWQQARVRLMRLLGNEPPF